MKNAVVSIVALAAAILLGGCGQSQTLLFNGKNLDGWQTHLDDQTVPHDQVWSVKEGVLRCEGKPNGFVRTVREYDNYILTLEWRWPAEPTNSGVLLHAGAEQQVWPTCIEAQLKYQNAGDFVAIQKEAALTVDGVRYQPEESIYKSVPKKKPTNETEPGQWNNYRIVSLNGSIWLYVNGLLQNQCTEASLTRGFICLQSEGSPIEFRNIVLEPIQ